MFIEVSENDKLHSPCQLESNFITPVHWHYTSYIVFYALYLQHIVESSKELRKKYFFKVEN